MMYGLLFLLAAGLNIVLGLHDWPAVLAGSLNDPDSYMRLVRLEQGIHAGHLVVSVARDDSGAGVMVEWSRLLDMLLWLMAAPLGLFVGWHRALFWAGVALGPLSVGALGVVLAYLVEPFAGRKFLWSAAVAAAVLPGVLTFAVPGVVHYHILLLVLIALTVALVARAWPGNSGYGFLAGLSGGFAIWLTPETMPFVLMAYAALLIRWMNARIGATLLASAAGFVDVLVFGLTIDPPMGGYGVVEIDRLSLVYAVLGLLVLAGAGGLWWLERYGGRWRGWAGTGLMAVLIGFWVAMFPKVAMGPYGVMPPAQMKLFLGVIEEQQPVHGADWLIFVLPGVLALAYAFWRVAAPPFAEERQMNFEARVMPPVIRPVAARGRLLWAYIALCTAVSVVLGVKFILFIGFSACAAAVMLPLALSEVSLRFEARPVLAMLGRLAVILAVLGVPEVSAMAVPGKAGWAGGGVKYPSCSLLHIAPLLAPAAGRVVLAEPQDSPELLYRTQVETVGSLYQHGVPAFLRDRDAWRAVPGSVEPAAVAATGAAYVLFCPAPGRYVPVADLPKDTLWDSLEAGTAPVWLVPVGQDSAGWRLYRVR